MDEPILMELGEPGQRALLLEEIEPQVAQAAGAPDDLVPQGYLRREAPELPELGQMQLLRHYLRLSQETIGRGPQHRHRPGHLHHEVQP